MPDPKVYEGLPNILKDDIEEIKSWSVSLSSPFRKIAIVLWLQKIDSLLITTTSSNIRAKSPQVGKNVCIFVLYLEIRRSKRLQFLATYKEYEHSRTFLMPDLAIFLTFDGFDRTFVPASIWLVILSLRLKQEITPSSLPSLKLHPQNRWGWYCSLPMIVIFKEGMVCMLWQWHTILFLFPFSNMFERWQGTHWNFIRLRP